MYSTDKFQVIDFDNKETPIIWESKAEIEIKMLIIRIILTSEKIYVYSINIFFINLLSNCNRN